MAFTNQDKKWRENMKRWKRGIVLLAIVAMMMQVLPINVWAEPVADEVTSCRTDGSHPDRGRCS